MCAYIVCIFYHATLSGSQDLKNKVNHFIYLLGFTDGNSCKCGLLQIHIWQRLHKATCALLANPL